jgi:hypothetical protein
MSIHSKKQKLYCFVDETGQDTKGELFIVAIVISAEDLFLLKATVERNEQECKKGLRKWFNTNRQRRHKYIQQIINTDLFKGKVCYAHYHARKDY